MRTGRPSSGTEKSLMAPDPILKFIREAILRAPRGTRTAMCADTELTLPELSHWFAGERPLPPRKALQILWWLKDHKLITLDHIKTVKAPLT